MPKTSDKDARRFAVFVTDQMLRTGSLGVHQLPFVERAFYELARQDSFTMGPIAEELRVKKVEWNVNPLKLHLEPAGYPGNCITKGNKKQYIHAKEMALTDQSA